MSGKGNCYDNSMAETFFKSIKAELIWRNRWETRRQAEGAIFNYISGFSNPRRHHSSLGGKSPLAFEQKATSMELIDRDPSPTRTVTAKCQCHSPQLRKVFQLHSFWPICQSATHQPFSNKREFRATEAQSGSLCHTCSVRYQPHLPTNCTYTIGSKLSYGQACSLIEISFKFKCPPKKNTDRDPLMMYCIIGNETTVSAIMSTRAAGHCP